MSVGHAPSLCGASRKISARSMFLTVPTHHASSNDSTHHNSFTDFVMSRALS